MYIKVFSQSRIENLTVFKSKRATNSTHFLYSYVATHAFAYLPHTIQVWGSVSFILAKVLSEPLFDKRKSTPHFLFLLTAVRGVVAASKPIIMSKHLTILLTALLAVSCAVKAPVVPMSQTKLWNSATYRSMRVDTPVTPPLIADLNVSPKKITFHLLPSTALLKTSTENIIKAAVKEALKVNGDADVLIGMEYQIKHDAEGDIESVTVTGYPATYVNFRHPSETLWLNEGLFVPATTIVTTN